MAVKMNPNLRKILEDIAYEALMDAAELAEDTGNALILDPNKNGRVYTTQFFTQGSGPNRVVRQGRPRAPHQASAPGEAPADDTGQLVRSSEVVGNRPAMTTTAAWRAPYAAYLQWGTDRMEARPFATLTLFAIADKIGPLVTARMRNG